MLYKSSLLFSGCYGSNNFMDTNEEKELIKQAQKNALAFGKIYDFYYPKIFGYVLRRTANFQIAQDITSETFFKALKPLWQFRFKGVPFSAWLYRIATNETANYFRKRKYTFSLDNESIPEPIALHNQEEEFMEKQEQFRKHEDFLKIQEQIAVLPIAYLGDKVKEGKRIRVLQFTDSQGNTTILGVNEDNLPVIRFAYNKDKGVGGVVFERGSGSNHPQENKSQNGEGGVSYGQIDQISPRQDFQQAIKEWTENLEQPKNFQVNQ